LMAERFGFKSRGEVFLRSGFRDNSTLSVLRIKRQNCKYSNNGQPTEDSLSQRWLSRQHAARAERCEDKSSDAGGVMSSGSARRRGRNLLSTIRRGCLLFVLTDS
jgi:hypothetical protein